MGNSMAIFSSLSRQQKEAVGLLQIGTFLECAEELGVKC